MTSIYIIKAGSTNNYKIGISNNTHSRLNGLQTAHYERLSIVHEKSYKNRFIASIIEEELHREYKDFNTLGEWFYLDDSHIKEIIETLNQEVTEVLLLKARVRELEKELSKIRDRKFNKGYKGILGQLGHVDKFHTLKKISFVANLNQDEIVKALYANGKVEEGDKIVSKTKIIDVKSRTQDRAYKEVVKKLSDSGVVEFKRGHGYYAKADYETALSVIGDA